jgi:isoamylase
VPMLVAGDELGRTQHGNNNAWCQDNELSWLDWEHADEELRAFTRKLIQLRRDHPIFRRRKFLEGREVVGSGLPDAWWFRTDGRRMTQRDWQQGNGHRLGVFLNGAEIPTADEAGQRVVDDSFCVLFNAHHEAADFVLPPVRFGRRWTLELSTDNPGAEPQEFAARDRVPIESRSILLLRRV